MRTDKIGNRIKEVRKSQNMTQTEFGEKIGVKGNTITGYENGTRRPSDSIINYICLLFDVDQTWLRTGEGKMELPIPDPLDPLNRFLFDENCNNLEIKFLTAYFGLKEKERKAFCELLVKMFPNAIARIVGDYPLDSPYEASAIEDVELSIEIPSSAAETETDYESSSDFASPLSKSATAEQEQFQPKQQKMPTPVPEDGQDDLEEFIRKHKKNLTAGQEQKILEMMQAMIEPQKQPLSVSAQQRADEISPKNGHRGTP